MSYLDWELFCEAIAELENHYNKQLTKFAKEAWFYTLKRLNEEQLYDAMRQAICQDQFMPTPGKILEYSGCDRFPGESPSTYGDMNRPALQSTEQVVENLTDEQCQENLKRIRAFAESLSMKKIRKQQLNPNGHFEAMRQMLLSGNPAFVRDAIAWAKTQDNVMLCYAKDGDTQASDMQLLDDMEF